MCLATVDSAGTITYHPLPEETIFTGKKFNPLEPRDTHGRWMFYHGTNRLLQPGDLLTPQHAGDGKHVYLTTDPHVAAYYAGQRDDPMPDGPHDDRYAVYQVEPTGQIEPDPTHSPARTDTSYEREPDYRTTAPLRVVRRLSYTHTQLRDAEIPLHDEDDTSREIDVTAVNTHLPHAKFQWVDLPGQPMNSAWGGGYGGGAPGVVPHDGDGTQLPPGAQPGMQPPRPPVDEPDNAMLPPSGPAGAGRAPNTSAGGGTTQEPFHDRSDILGTAQSTEGDDDAAYGQTGTGWHSGGSPSQNISGMWPTGGHGTEQAGIWSPGAASAVPPSSSAITQKVGKEGYIHGWICVRPPCGTDEQPVLDKLPNGAWWVKHPNGDGVGIVRKTNAGWEFTADKDGVTGTPTPTMAEAARRLNAYHNLQKLRVAAAEKVPTAASHFGTAAWWAGEVGNDEQAAQEVKRGMLELAIAKRDGKITPGERKALDKAAGDMYHHLTGEEPGTIRAPAKLRLISGEQFDTEADGALRASITSGITAELTPESGAQAETAIVTLGDGSRAVRKQFSGDTYGAMQADAEVLAARVGEAVGVPTALPVVKTGPTEIWMRYAEGKVAAHANGNLTTAAPETDTGRRIGLMDWITRNDDRHDNNWLINPDGQPVPIDNSSTFGLSGGGWRSPFTESLRDNLTYFKPDEINRIAQQLDKLRPEFKTLGREDWYRGMMTDWMQFTRQAAGAREQEPT
jgi:Rifampin ADP-ribosyl transferase